MAEPFRIEAHLLTDPGRTRSTNQDTPGVCEPSDAKTLSESGRLYVVADGAGGVGSARAGKVASRYAVAKVKQLYYQSGNRGRPAGERLQAAMLAANDAIRRHSQRQGREGRMATTMVAAVIQGDQLTIANVGDSRAYLISGDTVKQLTQDHSLVAGLVADGVITPEQATFHPQRNVIIHSLGSARAEPRIDLFGRTLQPGDLVLLCSDGLTRYASNEQLGILCRQEPADRVARRLVDFANAAGGADNITVITLRVVAAGRAMQPWLWWLLLAGGIALVILSGLAGVALMG